MVVLISFPTIPAKTVGTVGTNTRNPATVRVTRWLRVGTKWEQSGNKVRTVLHSERNHSYKPYFSPLLPPAPLHAQPLARCFAAPFGLAVRLRTWAHIRGIERVRAFPWNHLRGGQACMRVHSAFCGDDVANLLIANH